MFSLIFQGMPNKLLDDIINYLIFENNEAPFDDLYNEMICLIHERK